MPQLNPAPWFSILAFSWLVFFIIMPKKILAHSSPNMPTPQNPETLKTEPWNWLWQ